MGARVGGGAFQGGLGLDGFFWLDFGASSVISEVFWPHLRLPSPHSPGGQVTVPPQGAGTAVIAIREVWAAGA